MRFKFLSALILMVINLMLLIPRMEAQSHFGIRSGVNFASLTKSGEGGTISTNKVILPNFGIHLELGSRKNRLSFQTELHYIPKGFKRKITESSYDTYRINRYSLSLLAKYKFKKSTRITKKELKNRKYKTNGYLMAGPYLSGARTGVRDSEFWNQKTNLNFQTDLVYAGFVRVFGGELGIITSGGILLEGRSHNLIVDLRYIRGLTITTDNTGPDSKLKNTDIVLSVGIEFDLSK